MPQTEEHLQILLYLGVKRIVVALTKSDLGKIDNVTSQIREKLRETTFANAQIVPTSVRTSEGLEELKQALASEFGELPPPHDIGKPGLFVDRAFTLHGIGTVVTGTLTDGALRVGDTIFVQPKGISARIRSLQSHGHDVDLVQPGTRTAINLPDLEIGADVKRGDVITTQLFGPSSTMDVVLTRSPRLRRALPMKSNASAYVHHGTTRTLAKIVLAESESLAAGESAFAQLRLTAPLLGFLGDRFVVRDASEQHTRAGIVQVSHLLQGSRFSAAEIAAVLQRLSEHGDIFLKGDVAGKALVWRSLRDRAAKLIDAAHKANPERPGLELTVLRAELNSIVPAAFDALMDDLCANGFVRAGSAIARASHRPLLPPDLLPAAEKIRTALSVKPFDPPERKTLSLATESPSGGGEDRHLQQALRFLIQQGEIIELNEENILLNEAAGQMRSTVVGFISEHGPATASQLRQAIGTSRRVIIPFLEYLDRIGVTQRTGDVRQLRETKSATIARR